MTAADDYDIPASTPARDSSAAASVSMGSGAAEAGHGGLLATPSGPPPDLAIFTTDACLAAARVYAETFPELYQEEQAASRPEAGLDLAFLVCDDDGDRGISPTSKRPPP